MSNSLVRWTYNVFLRGYCIAEQPDQNGIQHYWVLNGAWCSRLDSSSSREYAFVHKYLVR
jgi:hypothetical protein